MRPKRSYFILSVMVIPVLYLLQNPHLSEPLHSATLSMLRPAYTGGQSVVGVFADIKENTGLFWETFLQRGTEQDRLARMESQLVRLDEVVKENERLRKLLDFAGTLDHPTIAAQVIGWDTSPWRRSLVIDKGSKEGIQKDMAVVVAEGLVGRVIEAGSHSSRVILLTDPEARVSALASESRSQGLAAGNGTSKLMMIYLDLESGISVDETVISSGVGATMPKGIRIGSIASLNKDPDGLHLRAQIDPFVNFTKLEEVLCLGFSHTESS